MSKRTKSMRLESLPDHSVAYKTTDEGTIAFERHSGEIVNLYLGNVRHKPPLDMWRDETKRVVAKAIQYHKGERQVAAILDDGLDEAKYQAGLRYGKIWRQAWRHKSPPHSDTTRIIVDGGPAAHEPHIPVGRDWEALEELAAVVGDAETSRFLDRLCGHEDWPKGEKRRFKRICRKGLERLADHWRKR